MSENAGPSPSTNQTPPVEPNYAVGPYRPEGGFSLGGLLRLVVVTVVTGIGLGLFAGWLGHRGYVAVLSSLGLALGLGCLGVLMVHLGRVRKPWLAGAVGLFAGTGCVAAIHYQDYQGFRAEMVRLDLDRQQRILRRLQLNEATKEEHLPPELRDRLPADLAGFRQRVEQQRQALASFPAFLDLRARQGVLVGRETRELFSPGYYLSYLYWGAELLLVAGWTAGWMTLFAGNPFCGRCERWKELNDLGSFPLSDSSGAVAAIQEGRTGALQVLLGQSGEEKLQIRLFLCPVCGQEGRIDVWLCQERMKHQRKRRSSAVTYPGEAWTFWQGLQRKQPSG
jgi:hypothetical protein